MFTSLKNRRISLWIGAILIVAVAAAGIGEYFAHAAPNTVTMPNTAAPEAKSATVTGDVPAGQHMELTLTLRSRNQVGLQRFVQDVAMPHAALYHHYLTPASFAANFGPDPAALKRVESFAQGAGLHVDHVLSGGLFLQVSGTAQQVEAAFHITLHTYHNAQGQSFYANAGNITLPQTISVAVADVAGLEDAPVHHRHSTGERKVPQSQSASQPHTANCLPTQGTLELTPPQLSTAYSFPAGKTGVGERIAMVEFDGYSSADIAAYTSCYASGVNVGNVVGNRLVDLSGALSAGPGAIEDELDIEVGLGLAPGVAKIDVYEAPNTNQGSIDMMSTIANDDADDTISDSWGECEADAGFGIASAEEMAFLQMAAQGQGMYVAAGDDGAYDCLSDSGGVPYYHGDSVSTDDPASNPYVIAVGGTNLSQNATTSGYIGETVWNNNPTLNATGGGLSQFWPAPTWQTSSRAVSVPGGIADPAQARAVPDVTADADPNTGYAVYCTAGSTCQSLSGGGWLDVGGTSAATPLWAALAADTNQLAATRIGLITPALYSLYGVDTAANAAAGVTINGTTYYDYATQKNGATTSGGSVVFNDITAGNNSFTGFATGFSAQAGYDAASGLGSMQGANIANFLSGEIHFTTPRFYMVAQGTNGGYWLSNYLLNSGDGNILPNSTEASNWVSLGGQTFQGMPAIADNGLSAVTLNPNTSGLLWITGVRSDGVALIGYWNPAKNSFGGWAAIPGMSGGNLCKGSTAEAFAQSTLFVTCMTPSGAIIIDAYNTSNYTWGGWATIGGGLNAPPTMATDGTSLLIFAQTPNSYVKNGSVDWFTLYTVGSGATTPWHPFYTTCMQSPAVAFTGNGNYQISCIAGDTGGMWANTFAAPAGTLSGWTSLGTPAGVKFHNATAVALDTADNPNVLLFTGQGTNNAAYVLLSTANPFYALSAGIWQIASLPGIFNTNATADYFNQ